jgi:1-acyl-sn-glycerol-3-phosphate acyltransferase
LSWFASVRITGQEHIPVGKPFVFVFNHMSVFDSILVILGLPAMEMRIFVGSGWDRVPILNRIVKKMGGIFLGKGAERSALRTALKSIKEGLPFGLAPEGTRSKTFALIPPMDGAAYLALKAGVPILPAGVTGTDKWWWNLTHLRRSHFAVYFGPAFTLPDIGRRPRSGDLPAYSDLIMAHIAALLPEKYHGVYAGSPAVAALMRGEDPWPYCTPVEEGPVELHPESAETNGAPQPQGETRPAGEQQIGDD